MEGDEVGESGRAGTVKLLGWTGGRECGIWEWREVEG